MTPAELVSTLEARGVRLRARGDTLDYEAPAETLGPAELEARALKPDVLAVLRGRALGVDWTRVSLWQLDSVLELTVPWADLPLILAPGCRIAWALRESEPLAGRVWCVCDVLNLLLTDIRPENARRIAEVTLGFGGAVVRTRRL